MDKRIIALVVLPLLLSACQSQQKRMEATERDAKVDSIVGVKMEDVNRQAIEDLDKRMSIEVKAKADSIVLSRQNVLKKDAAPPDNTIPNNLPVP